MAEIFFVDVIPSSPQFVLRGAAPQVVNSLTAGSYKLYNTADPVPVTVSPPVTAPGQPTGLTATAGAGQVSLSWTAPASTGGAAITDYVVQYSSNGGTSWTTVADGTGTGTTATVTGLANGTTYQFRVSAANSAGTGPASATATATPTEAPLGFASQRMGFYRTARNMRFAPSGAAGVNTRAGYIARASMTKLKLLFANTIVSNSVGGWGATALPGGTMVINAVSIEYPAGTYTPVKFGGAAGVTIADGGYVETDLTAIAIPAGAVFWVRTFCGANSLGTHGLVQSLSLPSGTSYTYAWSDTDLTTGGTISGNGWAVVPYVFGDVGALPSIVCIGDSISYGYNDGGADEHRAGIIQRSIPEAAGSLNFAFPGKKFTDLIGSWASFVPWIIQKYATHVVGNLGANGYASTAEAATFWGNAIFANARRIQCTVTPKTSSTDSWASETGQTVTLDHSALNALIKANAVGAHDFFDTNAALALSATPTRWQFAGGPFTGDGLHPNTAGYTKVVTDGAITLSKLGL